MAAVVAGGSFCHKVAAPVGSKEEVGVAGEEDRNVG